MGLDNIYCILSINTHIVPRGYFWIKCDIFFISTDMCRGIEVCPKRREKHPFSTKSLVWWCSCNHLSHRRGLICLSTLLKNNYERHTEQTNTMSPRYWRNLHSMYYIYWLRRHSVMWYRSTLPIWLKIITPHPPPPSGQNGRLFADDIFRCIFVNKSCIFWLSFHWSFNPPPPPPPPPTSGQNGRLFADDIFRCIFVNKSCIFWL